MKHLMYKFKIGKATVLNQGTDVSIIATGLMVFEAQKAAEKLKEKGVSARVINMSSIKPLDEQSVIDAATQTGAIVTAEEHSIIGGLGSAVAETIVKTNPVPIEMVGVNDIFGQSGKPNELMTKYNLTASDIVNKVEKVLLRK